VRTTEAIVELDRVSFPGRIGMSATITGVLTVDITPEMSAEKAAGPTMTWRTPTPEMTGETTLACSLGTILGMTADLTSDLTADLSGEMTGATTDEMTDVKIGETIETGDDR
jgi:hypothetical protein